MNINFNSLTSKEKSNNLVSSITQNAETIGAELKGDFPEKDFMLKIHEPNMFWSFNWTFLY